MKALLVSLAIFGVSVSTLAKTSPKEQVIEISVTEKGFEPSDIDVKAGVPVILKVTRKTNDTCATEIQIPSKNLVKALPLNTTVTVELGKVAKGNVPFSCAMDMITGALHAR